ncbi:hypothetical protein Mgra_00001418 [Meloidogyne graminicola]|uniref:Uncharacterized protein n=1 Tax=Meloidogyne graminicola TaxID=189291 RepID=A0A8S9ZZZ6_9BILA|nr:hypothetical protein Mgra_00001418 [Meloidogyne graminicola]
MVARAKSSSPPLKIMKNDELHSSTSCMEQIAFCEDLQLGCFDDTFKKFFAYSGSDVVSFDVENGERLQIYRHNESILISFTNIPQYFLWNVESGDQIAAINIQLPINYKPLWIYNVDNKYFILSQIHKKCTESSTVDNSLSSESSLFEIPLLSATQDTQKISTKIQSRLVSHIGSTPRSKTHLAVSSGFFVKIEKKSVRMCVFDEDEEEEDDNLLNGGNEDEEMEEDVENKMKEESSAGVTLHNKREYHIDSKFSVDDQNLVEFKEVYIVGDSLYAVLNIGRVYCWTHFTKRGLKKFNFSHFTLTGYEPTMCVSNVGTAFIGFGNAQIYKYNVNASSGVGRWCPLEHLLLESPPRSLLLCGDYTKMAVLQTDNSLCFINTSQMHLISRAEVLHVLRLPEHYNNKNYRFLIETDPAMENELLFVANARIGHIQWIDPFKWKTACVLDIAEENAPPPQDTFNMPNFQWLNTYLVCLSMQMLVTCECYRDNPQQTLIKFWSRSKSKSMINSTFKLENCVELNDRRIEFLHSTFDEFNLPSSSNLAELSKNEEEFLFIDSLGHMDIYKRDLKRRSRWLRDLNRHNSNWQKCSILSCSKVQQRLFATIQKLENLTFVVLRNIDEMAITQVIDNLIDAKQVEWSHSPNILLVVCKAGLVAFNSKNDNCAPIWIINQNNFVAINSNRFFTFVYNEQEVFLLNPNDGTRNNSMEEIRFSQPQEKIIALQEQSKDKKICNNIYFCGITNKGSLSIISSKTLSNNDKILNQLELEESFVNNNKKVKNTTAFSRLIEINEEKKNENKKRKSKEINNNNFNEEEEYEGEDKIIKKPRYLLKQVSIKKFIDGPTYTLPPISILAQRFVQACLVRRRP